MTCSKNAKLCLLSHAALNKYKLPTDVLTRFVFVRREIVTNSFSVQLINSILQFHNYLNIITYCELVYCRKHTNDKYLLTPWPVGIG